MKRCYETGMQDDISGQQVVSGGRWGEGPGRGRPAAPLSGVVSESQRTRRARLYPPKVLCLSAGLSLEKQTHYPRWPAYRQDGRRRRRAGSNDPQCPGRISSINHGIDRRAAECNAPSPVSPTGRSYELWRPALRWSVNNTF